MKLLTVICTASLLLSCVSHKDLQAEHQPLPNTSHQTKRQKPVEVPKINAFNGHYSYWLNAPSGKSLYSVISIHAVNEQSETVSFSTLFLGKRRHHTTPFKMVPGLIKGEKKMLQVQTDLFNFHVNAKFLSIVLYEGTSQHSWTKMPPMPSFRYQANVPDRETTISKRPEGKRNLNASTTLLNTRDLENLRADDLEIMKHSIFARHGAAFENQSMTDTFYKYKWYVPIFTMDEVRKKLTDRESKNISLIERFEKHAERYYLDFGR